MSRIKILLILLIFPALTFGWWKNTHKLISTYACINSKLVRGNFIWALNLDMGADHKLTVETETKTIAEWIFYGVEKEDASIGRSMNHFHNPLKQFADAGLIDVASIHHPSQLLFAQDGDEQDKFLEKNNSWEKAKYYYFNALLFTDEGMRHALFGKMFKGLGHQIHLIEDMGNPEHTRNDNHPFVTMEEWTEDHCNDIIEGFCANPIYPDVDLQTMVFDQSTQKNLVPISRLSDADSYAPTNPMPTADRQQGLAEYSNSNFVSIDTIFSGEFPHPCISNVDISKIFVKTNTEYKPDEKGVYLPKVNDGDPISHFIRLPYLDKYSNHTLLNFSCLDYLCYKDYTSMLIPRAVGYSAALLDYFFRGEIEISLPVSNPGINPPQKEGIYSLCTDPAVGFDKISLMVRNITANNEEMTNGSVFLVISYRTCVGNPFSPERLALEEERKFISVKYPGELSIPRDVPLRINFDLSETPMPYNAMDVTLSVVVKGNLGAELNTAVAIGFKDIGEPTPVDMFNNTDLVCFHGSYVPYTHPVLLQEVDINQNGEIDCDLFEIAIIPSEITPQYLSFNGKNADEGNYYFQYPKTTSAIQPGQSLRFYYLTDDYPAASHFSIHVDSKFISNPAIPINGNCQPFHTDDINNGYSYVNKMQWESAAEGYLHIKSSIYNYRGLDYFHVIRYQNIMVPLGTSCAQGSSASIQDESTISDEEKFQNRLQPKVNDINQSSEKVKK